MTVPSVGFSARSGLYFMETYGRPSCIIPISISFRHIFFFCCCASSESSRATASCARLSTADGASGLRLWRLFPGGSSEILSDYLFTSNTSILWIRPSSILNLRAVRTIWKPCIPAAPGLITSILRLGSRTTFRI